MWSRVPNAVRESQRRTVSIAWGQRKWTPAPDHPWKQEARRGARQKALREAAAAAWASLAWPSASPQALRPPGSAGLRSGPSPGRRRQNIENQMGDISKEVRKGTFYESYDI